MSKYSRIIAGCMSWGNWGKQFSTQEIIAQLDLTLEAGITTFDHRKKRSSFFSRGVCRPGRNQEEAII